jgi:hypothetical protein
MPWPRLLLGKATTHWCCVCLWVGPLPMQRIVELNEHFSKQPAGAVEQQGSPFAALFAVGGPGLLPQVSKGTALQVRLPCLR